MGMNPIQYRVRPQCFAVTPQRYLSYTEDISAYIWGRVPRFFILMSLGSITPLSLESKHTPPDILHTGMGTLPYTHTRTHTQASGHSVAYGCITASSPHCTGRCSIYLGSNSQATNPFAAAFPIEVVMVTLNCTHHERIT